MKHAPDEVLDLPIDHIADNGNALYLCSQQPLSYAEATSTYALGNKAITPGIGNGTFTKGNGDVSGRKLTVAAQTGIAVTATGEANHAAIVDTANSRLLAVTTIPPQVVTAGNTASTLAFDLEWRDPQ